MIFVAGSANLDFVVRASHIAAPGETVLGRNFVNFPGGKGANQAVACARAGGVSTQMLLAVGADAQAEPLLASLRSAGVQLHLRRSAQATGLAFIQVADDGQNAITVAPGANLDLAPEDLPSLQGCSHLLMQLEIALPSVLAYARAAHAQGVRVVLNAAPAQALPAALLETIDLLVVNESELRTLVPAARGLESALARLPVPEAVVTLGAHGCLALHKGVLYRHPGYAVPVLDTTGAGDTFCGALVAALDQGLPMEQALDRASAAAALACTRPGAQSSIATFAEVTSFLQSHEKSATQRHL